MTRSPITWLIAGIIALGFGAVLGMAVSLEVGLTIAVLGVGGLGAAAGAYFLAPSGTEESGLRQSLTELQRVERQLHSGVSQTEQAYRALLLLDHGPDGGEHTTAPATLDEKEQRIGEMIRARCDRVWEGIRTRRYVKREGERVVDLDGGALFAEIRDVVQEVATLYHSESDNAVLEVRLGDIALAVGSAAGELLQIARQVPYIDPAGWSIQEVVARLETVEKGLALYKKLSPYDHYVTGAMLAARIAVGANPISLAAWVLGKEGVKRLGGKFLASRAEAWLKELVEGSVALIYVQVARTYDPSRTYRSPEWVALVEALRIHASAPGIDHNRKFLLDQILRAPRLDEFAKMALLRALADDRAPDPRSTPPIDLATLQPAERQLVGTRLTELLSSLHGLHGAKASTALAELERRLEWGLSVETFTSGGPEDIRIAEGYAQLATVTRFWLGITRAAARPALSATLFGIDAGKSIGVDAADQQLRRAVADVYDGEDPDSERALVEPPRGLVGHDLAGPFVRSVADLLASAPAGWPIEHDHMVLRHASVLLPDRKRVTTAWQHYVAAASRQLRGRLLAPDVATWPSHVAPTILRRFREKERAVTVFDATTEASRTRWVLLFVNRVVVGDVPTNELSIDHGEGETHRMENVRLVRRKQRLGDSLVVCCGGHRLTVTSGRTGSFQRRFGPAIAALGLRPDALDLDRSDS